MKTIKQLLRQPVKLVLLLLLAAMGLAVLTVCVGQYSAARLARADLDDGYDTVGVLSEEYLWIKIPGGRRLSSKLPDEIQHWVTETLAERTDLVKTESYPQGYSAYAPGVCHDNFAQHGVNIDSGAYNLSNEDPYRCAMLEVTLTQVGTVVCEKTASAQMVGEEEQEYGTESVTVLCAGTVERAISLEQGFPSPEGKTIVLTIRADSRETLNAMGLEPGKRYLVYGLNYNDVEGREYFVGKDEQFEELFGPADQRTRMYRGQFDCMLTVCDYASLPDIIFGSNGLELRADLRLYHYWDEDQDRWVVQFRPAEEYMEKYTIPTIAALDGTAEDFLQSADAGLWRQALAEQEYNLHGFPVLAVDKLGYQLAFARGDARIVAGRDFTEAERADASRVCIIPEAVAQASGLSVGDTIDLQTYWVDLNISFKSTVSPAAAIYSNALGFTSEMESYTIVGLYRQRNAWPGDDADCDLYRLNPDTILVPMGSISGDAITGTRGVFYTLVLHNGKMTEFQLLQEEAGYPNLFICMDGSYTNLLSSLNAFEGVSRKALLIGLAAYGVIMVLMMVFVPLQQRRTLGTMASLGATRGGKIGHVLANALCILLPGSVLGGLAGALLWDQVAARLMESVNVSIPLEVNMAVTAPVLVALHLALMSAAVLLIAIPITTPRGLIKRK